MIDIHPELPSDSAAIEVLLDQAFGPDRHRKSSYSYRRGVSRLWPLCLTARVDGVLVGTTRAWPIRIGDAEMPAMLVGPVAIAASHRSLGLGGTLIRASLAQAAALGYGAAVLVGDAGYYGRFGFRAAGAWGITLLREDPARVLALPLDSAMPMPTGLASPWRSVRGLRAAA